MALIYREAAVAGQFYPNNVQDLQKIITQCLNYATTKQNKNTKALIVPHAAYIYSGEIAASAYNSLYLSATAITNIILLGPAHYVAFKGVALSSANYFRTPLGQIKVNSSNLDKISHLKYVNYNDNAHKNEHSLEVQLPFLQTLLTNFTITPLLVGDCSASELSNILKILWSETDTLFIISSDLSHFYDYNTAQKIDQLTSEAIIHFQPEKIQYDNACGRNAINGFLNFAQHYDLNASILDIRNSGDTAGDKERVVGYGAYLFQ